jgi:hypothetical protein
MQKCHTEFEGGVLTTDEAACCRCVATATSPPRSEPPLSLLPQPLRFTTKGRKMKTRTIRHILVGAVVLGSASGLVAEREAKAYSWTEFVTSPPPPYKIYVPTVSRPTTNTAPVTLAPTYADGQLTLYALLDNTDSSGDYNLYEYYGFDAEWFSLSQSGTGVAFDAYYGSTAPWFVTRAGHVWSLENGRFLGERLYGPLQRLGVQCNRQ